MSEEVFVKMHKLLSDFLSSEGKQVMLSEQSEMWRERLSDYPKLDFKTSRRHVSECLADVANITTIATALSAYMTTHPDIPYRVLLFLQRFLNL